MSVKNTNRHPGKTLPRHMSLKKTRYYRTGVMTRPLMAKDPTLTSDERERMRKFDDILHGRAVLLKPNGDVIVGSEPVKLDMIQPISGGQSMMARQRVT